MIKGDERQAFPNLTEHLSVFICDIYLQMLSL